MKIIDQTPFFNHDTGEISIVDRSKAIIKYGAGWVKEVEAQEQVISVLEKILDRNYTLLRNVTPPALEASFPLILVGPAGVYVMYVSPLTGMFRAKGDQWGTISGSTYKNEKINLLTRTELMARAIQVYLQRHGFSEIINIEGVLLFSDPSVHVDSVRPIIRVVMRDALERFAISLMQARVVLSTESTQNIIVRIVKSPEPTETQPVEHPAATSPEPVITAQAEESYVPGFSTPEPPAQTEKPSVPVFAIPETPTQVEKPYVPGFILPESTDSIGSDESASRSTPEIQPLSTAPSRKGLKKSQWGLLIAMFVIWCLLISIFLFLVVKDQPSILGGILP